MVQWGGGREAPSKEYNNVMRGVGIGFSDLGCIKDRGIIFLSGVREYKEELIPPSGYVLNYHSKTIQRHMN